MYFSCNMHQPQDLRSLPEAVQKLVKLRQRFQSQECLDTKIPATLPYGSLAHQQPIGSQFHLDWSEAKNIAWATDGKVLRFLSAFR